MRLVRFALGCGCVAWSMSCGGSSGDPGDAWAEVPVVIFPDSGPRDPGSPTDPGLLDPGARDPGQGDAPGTDPGRDPGTPDPGAPDPGTEDPGSWDPGAFDSGPRDPGCVRNCTNRQCGSDGCGGSCGQCTAPAQCLSFQCVCTPNCTNKTCGDDGCGATCPPGCPEDRPCAPEGKCMGYGVTGSCPKSTTAECDGTYEPLGGTGSSNSDILDLYPSSCGGIVAHGPERVYRLVPDTTGTITVKFSQSTPPGQSFLQVYVLKGKDCLTTSCIQAGKGTFSVSVEAGQTYWFVVDADVNNTGMFSLFLDCDWYTPPRDY